MAVPEFTIRPLTRAEGETWVRTLAPLAGGEPEPVINRLVPVLHQAGHDPSTFLLAESAKGQVLGLLRCRFLPGAAGECIAPLIPDPAHTDEVGRALLARFLSECWGRRIRQITAILLLEPPLGDPDQLRGLLLGMGFASLDAPVLIRASLKEWTPTADRALLAWRSLHELGNLQFVQVMAQCGLSPSADQASRDLLALRQTAGGQLEAERWLVGYRDGQPVGLVIPQAWPQDPTTGSLLMLGVAPAQRGKGYGWVLFERGLAELKAAWVETYQGGVNLDDAGCARLFASLDYTVLEHQERYAGPVL